jgi:hypothetical protein
MPGGFLRKERLMTAENPVVAFGGTATPDFRDSGAPRFVGWFRRFLNAPYSIQMEPPVPIPPVDSKVLHLQLMELLNLQESKAKKEGILFGCPKPGTVAEITRLKSEINKIESSRSRKP